MLLSCSGWRIRPVARDVCGSRTIAARGPRLLPPRDRSYVYLYIYSEGKARGKLGDRE